MDDSYTFTTSVSYWDVDHEKKLTLRGLFKFMQEAAILHADQFDIGVRSMEERKASWVLNRLSAAIERFPTYGEKVRVVTWSSQIRAFKGFRDYRLYCGEELVVSASSLWIYVDLQTRSLTRVPKELADRFPARTAGVFLPDLDRHRLAPLENADHDVSLSLRYSDVDGNGHVNNTVYFDLLQTALEKGGTPARPRSIDVQFVREMYTSIGAARIRIEKGASSARFRIDGPSELYAHGTVAY